MLENHPTPLQLATEYLLTVCEEPANIANVAAAGLSRGSHYTLTLTPDSNRHDIINHVIEIHYEIMEGWPVDYPWMTEEDEEWHDIHSDNAYVAATIAIDECRRRLELLPLFGVRY